MSFLHRLFQCALFVLAIVSSAPGQAALGCVDTDPLPIAPPASAETASFSASNSDTETFNVVLWRQSCTPNASRLFVRLTPTAGAPVICSDFHDFHLLEGTMQYSIALRTGFATNAVFCQALTAATTLVLVQDTGDPSFSVDAAMTLIYAFLPSRLAAGDLPATGSGPPPIIPVVGLWWNPA
ncbi:MAG TPA: hypothetical protein VFC24_09580, partial [Casimicrobiaceae bacterium]|nr:hypothetical protein [Casimicrobiaceae bacterium]